MVPPVFEKSCPAEGHAKDHQVAQELLFDICAHPTQTFYCVPFYYPFSFPVTARPSSRPLLELRQECQRWQQYSRVGGATRRGIRVPGGVSAMAHQGQAADYYNNNYQHQNMGGVPYEQTGYQSYPPPSTAPPPQQPQYQQQQPYQDQQPNEPKYSQQPPTYGQNFTPPRDNKQTFQETFKIQKPKYNDIWAGLLVSNKKHVYSCVVFGGASGLTIHSSSSQPFLDLSQSLVSRFTGIPGTTLSMGEGYMVQAMTFPWTQTP